MKSLKVSGNVKYTDYDENVLKHIQKLELMILKDFINICEDNDLTYYIYGGSLLGAIRHQGFIPWDDDIDVIMFRQDYEKFKKIFLSQPNEKYELLTHENYDDYFFLFSKLMLKGTKFEEWWVNQVTFNVGINIDIFVLDNVSDNNLKCFFQTKICRMQDRLLTMSAIKLVGYPFLTQKFSNFLHVLLKALRIKPINIINKSLKWLTRYENTQKVCDICALNHPQIYDRDDYGKGIKVEFEDIKVNAPVNFDTLLTQIYGEYMQLPPEEDRYNHITYDFDFGKYKL